MKVSKVNSIVLIVYLLFNSIDVFSQSAFMDSLIKSWGVNGVPANRINDYNEYIKCKSLYKPQFIDRDTIVQQIKKNQPNCENTGFEAFNFNYWVRWYGTSISPGVIVPNTSYSSSQSNGLVGNAYNTSVFAVSTFVINYYPVFDSILATGYDPYSFDGTKYTMKQIDVNSGNLSARINNAKSGFKSRKIDYTFIVTPSQTNFIYKHAIFLSDGGHNDGEQASFSITLKDSLGNVFPIQNLPYYVNANNAINDTNFIKSPILSDGLYDVYYKKWRVDTINLCQYIGKTFTITFEASDCTQGAHFCYAYIDALCDYQTDLPQVTTCRDSLNDGFIGQNGFVNYQWTDSHGNLILPIQTGNQQFLNFTQYMQNCSTGNCSVNEGDLFTLTATNKLGCVFTSNYSVKNYSIGISSVTQTNSCAGLYHNIINIQPNGGQSNGNYNYEWYSNNCSGIPISTSNTLTNITPGTYCVHITSGSCNAKDSTFQVIELPLPIKENTINLPGCIDSLFTLQAIQGAIIYRWYKNNQILLGQNSDSLVVNPLDLNSNYTVAYTEMNGCKDSIRFTLKNNNNNLFKSIHCPNDTISLLIAPNSINPESYQWYNNGVEVSAPLNGNNDSLKIPVNDLGNYYVTYYVNNCKYLANNFSDLFPENYFIPNETTNVFTPNNDGANDVFYPYVRDTDFSSNKIDIETGDYELTIYNRWGTLVFKDNQYSKGWNGKTLNGVNASDGTYFWIASYLSNCNVKNERIIKKGFLQLMH